MISSFDTVSIIELTLILNIIGQCDIKYIMMLQITILRLGLDIHYDVTDNNIKARS